MVAGAGLAVTLLMVRLFTKTASVTALAHLSGISWRKGVLTGLSLAPMSVFVILLLEHARLRGVDIAEELQAIVAVTMLLEMFGPIIIQRALIWARETAEA